MGWRMFLLVALALGLAVAAIASLLSVGETPSVRPSTTQGRGTDSEEGIREESREALRDVLRNIDSDAGSRQ